jgi:hypothetical protein
MTSTWEGVHTQKRAVGGGGVQKKSIQMYLFAHQCSSTSVENSLCLLYEI